MSNSHDHTEKHHGIVFFGYLKCLFGVLESLCRVGGLKHRHLGRDGIMTGILLVLRGMHSGVVCHANNETCVDSGVRHRKERVGRHVEANVLHSASTALTVEGRAKGDLESDLFVGSPLAIYIVIFSRKFGDLRAGSSGIA